MTKKMLYILGMTIALVVTLAVAGIAFAQAVVYTSGFQVQNLSSQVANTVVTFYNQNGTIAASNSYTISANSSRTFFPLSDVSSGFNGSVIISSDQSVRAINNLLGSGPANYFDATPGFQSGAASVSLPLIMCSNNGFDTWFNVQNAGSATGNITITYAPGSDGVAGSETASIPVGAAKTFNQKLSSTTKNCSTLAGGSGKFIGSATVVGDQPIVAAVNQLNTTSFKVLMSYGGFTAGSPMVSLPLIMANNSGFYTGLQVQNTGGSPTTVHVSFSANTGGVNNPVHESFLLAAGASKTIIQAGNDGINNWGTLGKYIGGATITNTASQPLVAIVNQVRPSPALGNAYNGFDPSAATTQASAPLIMANNSTYYTGIQVQNVDPSSTETVTITYSTNSAGVFNPSAEVFTLGPGVSKTIIQAGSFPGNGSTVNNWGVNKYIGSATITSSGGNVVAIVNQVSLAVSGDQFASYDAFNY